MNEETKTEKTQGNGDLAVVRRSFTLEDMEKAFDAGGDWRMACKNLSDGVYTKEQWADFQPTN